MSDRDQEKRELGVDLEYCVLEIPSGVGNTFEELSEYIKDINSEATTD